MPPIVASDSTINSYVNGNVQVDAVLDDHPLEADQEDHVDQLKDEVNRQQTSVEADEPPFFALAEAGRQIAGERDYNAKDGSYNLIPAVNLEAEGAELQDDDRQIREHDKLDELNHLEDVR